MVMAPIRRQNDLHVITDFPKTMGRFSLRPLLVDDLQPKNAPFFFPDLADEFHLVSSYCLVFFLSRAICLNSTRADQEKEWTTQYGSSSATLL
jgi:hypothetical protein